MRVAILLVPFTVDIALKILARTNPDALGRFSFSMPAGTIGLAPSVNSVLAFSLPVPNHVIWPVGWAIVAILLTRLLRSDVLAYYVSGIAARIGFVRRFRQTTTTPFDDTSCDTDTARRCRRLALPAIILGAISNLTDRTFLGGVTDYLSFTNLFPAFNVADLLIIGGIAGWLIQERRPSQDA